jgi:magnesium chelatase subunit I
MAALHARKQVVADDLWRVAPLVLRHRLRRNPLDDTGSDARVQRALQEVVPR